MPFLCSSEGGSHVIDKAVALKASKTRFSGDSLGSVL